MTLSVSCLMATRDRLSWLKASVASFCAQTYADRELVIATDGTPLFVEAVRRFLSAIGQDHIRLIVLPQTEATLGAVRNVLLDAAHGDLVCQWDDDDLSHPERLALQVAHLQANGADACFLTDQLHLFWEEREAFWVDWRIGRTVGPDQWIPGTLLMRRAVGLRYPDQRRHEDSMLRDALAAGGARIVPLSDAGWAFGRVFHGANTFSRAHHRGNAEHHARQAVDVRAQLPRVWESLQSFHMPRPLTIGVRNAAGQLVFLD